MELAFLSPSRLALAEGMGLDSVLNPEASAADMEMTAHVEEVARSAVFVVARARELRKLTAQATTGAAQLNQILEQVEFLSLVAEPKGDNLNVALEADCKTAGDALRLSTLIEGLRWMGRRPSPIPERASAWESKTLRRWICYCAQPRLTTSLTVRQFIWS